MACLQEAGAGAAVYDANLDFLSGHLFRPEALDSFLPLIAQRQSRGDYQDLADPALTRLLADATGDAVWMTGLAAQTPDALATMRGERFYDPASLVAARRVLEACYGLASLAYYPLRLHWHGLHHPEARDWQEALALASGRGHPFGVLSASLVEKLAEAEHLVFCLEKPDQALAALALGAAARRARPELAIICWGPGLKAPAPPSDLVWLPGRDPGALLKALGLPARQAGAPGELAAEGYLAPEAVRQEMRAIDLGAAPPTPEELKSLRDSGARAVRWLVPETDESSLLEASLRAASRAGLWSQVELPWGPEHPVAQWCAANPNLAHSLLVNAGAGSWFSGPAYDSAAPEPRVGVLEPMPGRPLWRWLEAPAHLLLYLRRHGARFLRTHRVRADGSLYRLGENVAYTFLHYPDLDQWHLERILKLIVSAGKVKPDWLRHNLERSFLIAHAVEEGVMVATETLKHPRPEYIQKVRERTGLDFSRHLERGYIVVRPEYRGLGVGDELVRGCLARAPGYKTFLAIAAENKIAQELTARHGSRMLTRYYSHEMGKEVEIWTPRDQEDLPEAREGQCE
ncbi:hypothetical protein AAU61_17620 [Desulfocarbo indianensis]|nr:hypothetical protein AAU61_17620 [Desulfocarbo indianensis]